jgi:hypothetical protein
MHNDMYSIITQSNSLISHEVKGVDKIHIIQEPGCMHMHAWHV